MNEKKVCKKCLEIIDAKSKICPNCLTKQESDLIKYMKIVLKCIGVLFALLIALLVLIVILFGDDSNNEGKVPETPTSESHGNPEENLRERLSSVLSESHTIEEIEINSKTYYGRLKIRYTDDDLKTYTCGKELAEVSQKVNEKVFLVENIQFVCDKNGEIINYIEIDNLNNMKDKSAIQEQLRFYDINFNDINVTYYELKEEYEREEAALKEALEKEEEENFKKSSSNFNYKDVLRNPSDYESKKAYWFGEVLQIVSHYGRATEMRVGVNCTKYSYISGYSCPDAIYVTYIGSQNFIEKDMLKMWGTMHGTVTYTTVLGASVTVPKFNASYIELQ